MIDSQALLKQRDKNLYRTRRARGPRDEVISFCSNDYLGLSRHPEVVEAFIRGAHEYGVGSGASGLVSGYTKAHEALEKDFARFLGRERALLFTNGTVANFGVMQALLTRHDLVLQDKRNHASLMDAPLLAQCMMKRYRHTDLTHLESLLQDSKSKSALIVTDGVFSMDGNLAPVGEIAHLAERYGATVMVDDAHGIGVLGKRGAGSLEHLNINAKEVPILNCPLGKAFGGLGSIVAGDEVLIETLLQFSRTYIYSTAMPPAMALAMQASLAVIQSEPERRLKLFQNVDYFKAGAAARGISLLPSETPIQSLVLGSAESALKLSAALKEKGLHVAAIRPPTVPEGTSRLRITLSAAHTVDEIDQLLYALGNFRV